MIDLPARKRLAIAMFRFAYYHHEAFTREQAHAAVLDAAAALGLDLSDVAVEFRAWALEQPERGSDAAALEGWARLHEREQGGR